MSQMGENFGIGEQLKNAPPPSTTNPDRTDEDKQKDAEIAERLSRLIEDANSRVVPLCKMIRKVSSIVNYIQSERLMSMTAH